MSPTQTAPSLATMLESRRLAVRARRIERVIDALRERERTRAEYRGAVPAPLRHAIRDFKRELEDIDARRRALDLGCESA